MHYPYQDTMRKHTPSVHFDARMRRLMTAVNAASDTELAKTLGITHQSVSSARKRGSFPGSWLTEICERFGVSADWLLWGTGPMRRAPVRDTLPSGRLQHRDNASPMPDTDCPDDALVRPPRLEPRLAPGACHLEPADRPARIVFERRFLDRIGTPGQMAVVDMPGEAMSPTIQRGDCLLLDLSRSDAADGGIHLLAIEGGVSVRRLERLPGRLRLLADNPLHPPVEVDYPAPAVHILGRVIWFGHTLG